LLKTEPEDLNSLAGKTPSEGIFYLQEKDRLSGKLSLYFKRNGEWMFQCLQTGFALVTRVRTFVAGAQFLFFWRLNHFSPVYERLQNLFAACSGYSQDSQMKLYL